MAFLNIAKEAVPCIANIAAGAYKGYMNAAGQPVSPEYLAYVLASTSTFRGLAHFLKTRSFNRDPEIQGALILANAMASLHGLPDVYKEKKPAVEGVKAGAMGTIFGGLEIMIGYGLGWAAQKVLS